MEPELLRRYLGKAALVIELQEEVKAKKEYLKAMNDCQRNGGNFKEKYILKLGLNYGEV